MIAKSLLASIMSHFEKIEKSAEESQAKNWDARWL